MTNIPDFTAEEIKVVQDTLQERYNHAIETHLADVELRLDKDSTQLSECPAIYWKVDDCNFIICKTGKFRYRNQFYYRGHEQYGTGIEEYDDMLECISTLLRVQADHELERKGAFGEKP